jgi:hypothetical protein
MDVENTFIYLTCLKIKYKIDFSDVLFQMERIGNTKQKPTTFYHLSA